MKYFNYIFSVVIIFSWTSLSGQPFSAEDDIGRVLPQFEEVGSKKPNKQVGLFYFLWQGDSGSPTSEVHWDLSKIYQYYPEVFHDFYHPNWGGGSKGAGKYYFWGESIYGYYRGDDYWVHLKNIQLLTDAQVDFLIIDATNRLTYATQVNVLLKAITHVRKQGKAAPKIVFYTNSSSADAMQEIYDQFYAPNLDSQIKDNWYYLEDKPLIIGISKDAKGRNYEKFFTIRESQWPNEPEKINGWPWIEFQRPQKVYKNHKGEREIVNVSASQHPNLDASMGGSAFYGKAGNWGRSYRKGSPGNPEKDIFYGYNIQEQWDFALGQNVPFVFITGWNEWIAGKWSRTDEQKDHAHFVDQANAEYSRDLEPTLTAGLKDNYYLQMVSNILRYKGSEKNTTLKKQKLIPTINSWDKVQPIYIDYIGDVLNRNHPGAQSEPSVVYVNQSGRNDLTEIKLIAAETELGFFVQTAKTLSTRSKENWMTLWLNIDQNYLSGWHGYDARVIQGNRFQRFQNGAWLDIQTLDFEQSENNLLIRVPLRMLNLPNKGYKIEFKWSDNMLKDDPMDWYVNGDAAPGGRMNLTVTVD